MGAIRFQYAAEVASSASLGRGTEVQPLAQICEDAVLGMECFIGRGAYVGPGVRLGDRVVVHSQAHILEPAVLADGVYVGIGAVLANDPYPRAVDAEGMPRGEDDWTPSGVTVHEGASIGARAVIAPGVTIGRHAMVAAGAVVDADVPEFAHVAGAPAKRFEWVGRAGVPLTLVDHVSNRWWQCPETGECYLERDGLLEFQI